jgi:hypothetical protein
MIIQIISKLKKNDVIIIYDSAIIHNYKYFNEFPNYK